jgi:hypothetical protein
MTFEISQAGTEKHSIIYKISDFGLNLISPEILLRFYLGKIKLRLVYTFRFARQFYPAFSKAIGLPRLLKMHSEVNQSLVHFNKAKKSSRMQKRNVETRYKFESVNVP